MFGKIKCSKCSRKIDKKFDFCPYCATPLKNMKEEYGLLGRDDDFGSILPTQNNSFMDKIFSSALNSAMKIMEKEMQSQLKEERVNKKNLPIGNLELFINGKKVNLPGNIAGLQIEEVPNNSNINNKKTPKAKMPKVSEETMKNSIKLPRKEAKSSIKRTSDKVVYELETPGIVSLNNVLISKTENSIEIKAYTDKTVYYKTLPGKLPLMQYSIVPSEGKLILEFKA